MQFYKLLLSSIFIVLFCSISVGFAQFPIDTNQVKTKRLDFKYTSLPALPPNNISTMYVDNTGVLHYLKSDGSDSTFSMGGSGVTSVFGRTGAVVAVSGDYTTTLVTEGTNLYFTNTRARNAVSANAPLTYSSATGVFGITQSSATTDGYLSSTDWNTFNNKGNGTVTSVALSVPSIFSVSGSPVTTSGALTATLVSQSANQLFASPDGVAGTPSFRALVSDDIPNLNASKITTGTLSNARGGTGLDTSTATNGQLLIGNGSGFSLNALTAGSGISITNGSGTISIAATGGTGTVTSVALALPASVFSVSGSPVTTSGTLTGSFSSQSANTVFAAPDSTSGTPTFRALVSNDIPNLSAAKITSGTLATARGGTGLDASGATNGQLLIGNGSGFSLATLTQGSGITITNGSGTITIASSGGTASWSSLTNPSANLSLSMGSNTTTFTWGNATGSATNLFNLTDTSSNSGQGYILNLGTANASSASPMRLYRTTIPTDLSKSYLQIGGSEFSGAGFQQIGFGYNDQSGATVPVAAIGFNMTNASGNTKGDIYIATRDVTTNTAPSIRFRVSTSGAITFSPSGETTPGTYPSAISLTGAAHTGLGAYEPTDLLFDLSRTVSFANGSTLSAARASRILAPTYINTVGGTKTITKATTLSIGAAPTAGTNVTITSAYALQIESGNSSFLGDVEVENNLKQTGNGGLYISEGTNRTMGVATLSSGTVTVSTTKVTANSRIFLTGQNSSGTPSELTISARTAGTSFTITSASVLDTRDVAWIIIEPN